MENLKYSEIVKQNRLNLDRVKNQKPIRIRILSNIVTKQIEAPLTFMLLESNIVPLIEFGNYDNIVQDSRDSGNQQVVIVHYDLVNILSKKLKFVENYTEFELKELSDAIISEINFIIENLSDVPLIIFNTFSSLGVYANSFKESKVDNLSQLLNQHLYSKQTNNLNIIDINNIISKIGVPKVFNYKLFYLAKTLYSVTFWKEYAFPISLLIRQISGYGKKAILFDCDNTLWRGILGEDGFNGIDMSSQSSVGKIFSEVQQIAVWLSRNGVIVGLCSKNNSEDVDKVFNEHSDIILTLEDVIAKRINWQNKADNIREIASELNIGLDSILFVDDSSFEINLIKEQLPDVNTLQVPREIDQYPQRLLTFISTNLYLSDNIEDREKVRQYKAQAERTKEYASHGSIESYLSSINMRLLIKEDDQSQIKRITQLTQKTNQFNLTTKRYTEKQIGDFLNSPLTKVFSASVADKFGDNGLTAIVIVDLEGDTANIDTFIMSCRIMGRTIEYAIMNYIVNNLCEAGMHFIEAEYRETAKNKPVSEFYEHCGFKIIETKKNKKTYRLGVHNFKQHEVGYILYENDQ